MSKRSVRAWEIVVTSLALALAGPLASRARAQGTLDAPEAAREVSHHIAIRLVQDVAEIDLELELALDAPQRAEVRYVWPLPEGGRLVRLEVCGPGGACRTARAPRATGSWADPYAIALHGAPRARTTRPITRAWARRDRLEILAAPVGGGATLRLHATIAAPLAIRGGRARLELPARDGSDPRLAPADVEVSATEYDELSIGAGASAGPRRSVPAGEPVIVEARVASAFAALSRARARDGGDAHLRASAVEPRRAVPHDVLLAIDVSPSMEDVPAGRTLAALRAALASLPAGSRVRALRFGARARWVEAAATDPIAPERDGLAIEAPASSPPPWSAPDASSAAELASAIPGALGSRTDFGAVIPLALAGLADAAAAPLLVVVGDGWLDRADFLPIEARGARVVIANVSDEALARGTDAAVRAASRTMALALGPTLAGAHGPALESITAEPSARIALTLRHPRVLVPRPALVPTGEPLAWSGLAERGSLDAIGTRHAATPASEAVAALLDPSPERELYAIDPRVWGDLGKWERPSRGVPPVPGGIGGVSDALTPRFYYGMRRALAIPRIRVAQVQVVGTASIGVLRRMVRSQLGPRVTACFARARAGRPEWHARALLHLVIAHREVLGATVAGENVDAALEACILERVDDLQVPPTHGVVGIHYPFRADPQPPRHADPLDAETAAMLDALGGDEPADDAPR